MAAPVHTLAPVSSRGPTIVYLYTTFPKATETFLQREMTALLAQGLDVRLYSLWGGGGEFQGRPVRVFNKWRLLELLWMIPWVALTRSRFFGILLKGLVTRRPPSWINFWENMLGAGFAGLFHREIKRLGPVWVHAAWSGGPATAAWCLRHLIGTRYSAGAHAYDIYEYGGDWWLEEKLADAAFIHTSTEMAKRSLVERGIADAKVEVIRRGLNELPPAKALRSPRLPLRLLCVARLVEKKGLPQQLQIYAALKARGIPFEARLIGDGPLRRMLEAEISSLGLPSHVFLAGHLSQQEVRQAYEWADVLLHTGIVARSGDRDGLPNVIPEAMAAGVLVVTSPAAATTEAITDEVSGLVADVHEPGTWVRALERLASDDALAERLRRGARAWVEREFDAAKNSGRLHALLTRHAAPV
ncbi:MAG: glycosyltransferase family 4 protein [Opitutaceae bacterium]|nr:glycosyltransferase family 4 protein [Opitutaceae bacterium]